MAVLIRYDEWAEHRVELSGQEATGDYPHYNDWSGSDDDGCDLAHDLASTLRDALKFLDAVVTLAEDYTEDDLLRQARILIENVTTEG